MAIYLPDSVLQTSQREIDIPYLSWQTLHMVVYEAGVNGSHKLREIIHSTCFGKLQEAG